MVAAALLILFAGCALDVGDLPELDLGPAHGRTRVADAYPAELGAALADWRVEHGDGPWCDVGALYVSGPAGKALDCSSLGRLDGCLIEHVSELWGDSWTVVVVDQARASEVVERELGRWLRMCARCEGTC